MPLVLPSYRALTQLPAEKFLLILALLQPFDHYIARTCLKHWCVDTRRKLGIIDRWCVLLSRNFGNRKESLSSLMDQLPIGCRGDPAQTLVRMHLCQCQARAAHRTVSIPALARESTEHKDVSKTELGGELDR